MADLTEIATLAIAHGNADRDIAEMEDYLRRGRPLAHSTLSVLEDQFVAAFRRLAATSENLDFGDITDLCSEYRLRKIEPPYHLASAEIATIAKIAERRHATMSLEEQEAISQTLLNPLFVDRGSSN